MTGRYRRSEELLARALELIPLGAQTFSKSITQFPRGVSPHFASRASGSRLWDADGNEYVDFVNALAAVLLGYADPEVNRAVMEQLERGVTFTLNHELEAEVAERLVRLIPCAEQVRFGKNGTDATSAAIRLARAHTGRSHVAVCGYHGWQDWYIATTSRDAGVPREVAALSHRFAYGDLGDLERVLNGYRDGFAAVIMEPMTAQWPDDGYLDGVRELAHRHGALLIFDETITGFRFHLGGAQALFEVTPDLAAFGKGMANGLPLSAVVGPRELMRGMEKIFYSATFGGETLSLAAAGATLDCLERDRVPERLRVLGERLLRGLRLVLEGSDAAAVFAMSGHPSWTFLAVRDGPGWYAQEVRTLLLQELFARGILSLGTHNLSASHTQEDVDRLAAVYEDLLPWIAGLAAEGRVREHLRTEPIVPLFRVR